MVCAAGRKPVTTFGPLCAQVLLRLGEGLRAEQDRQDAFGLELGPA